MIPPISPAAYSKRNPECGKPLPIPRCARRASSPWRQHARPAVVALAGAQAADAAFSVSRRATAGATSEQTAQRCRGEGGGPCYSFGRRAVGERPSQVDPPCGRFRARLAPRPVSERAHRVSAVRHLGLQLPVLQLVASARHPVVILQATSTDFIGWVGCVDPRPAVQPRCRIEQSDGIHVRRGPLHRRCAPLSEPVPTSLILPFRRR